MAVFELGEQESTGLPLPVGSLPRSLACAPVSPCVAGFPATGCSARAGAGRPLLLCYLFQGKFKQFRVMEYHFLLKNYTI